jgi:hypothetical protein
MPDAEGVSSKFVRVLLPQITQSPNVVTSANTDRESSGAVRAKKGAVLRQARSLFMLRVAWLTAGKKPKEMVAHQNGLHEQRTGTPVSHTPANMHARQATQGKRMLLARAPGGGGRNIF